MQVLLPYSAGALLDDLHKMGKVTDTHYTEQGTRVTAHVPRCLVGKLEQYATTGTAAGAHSASHPAASVVSMSGDADNGQLGSSQDDDFYTDFDVDNASLEDVLLESDWQDDVDVNDADGVGESTAGWGNGASSGQQQQVKEGYQPHVAGSRAGRRAAQQRKQQQGSLAAHQLPGDWQEVLRSGSESSTVVRSTGTI